MNCKKHYAVAIDGPSGAGKSSVAKAAAKRLGAVYVDTGAIYRTIGLAAKRAGILPEDAQRLAGLLPRLSIELTYDAQGAQRMLLNGRMSPTTSAHRRSPAAPRRSPQSPRSVPFCWRCSGKLPGPAVSSWTGETSVPWFCPRRRSKFF